MQYAYKAVKDHYCDFKGRANRPEFWYFQLYMLLLVILSSLLFGFLQIPMLSMLVSLALFLPALGISVRRLHDLGKKWYWLLLSIIPGFLVGFFMTSSPTTAMVFNYIQLAANIFLLVLFCMKGEDKENAWGKPIK